MMKLVNKLAYQSFTKTNVLDLPETPGVYLLCDAIKKPLYVGKSVSLKHRVNSYLANSLVGKTAKLVSKVKYFSYIKVNSEIEALLLEAKLVRKFNTQYNIELKDDKHPLYIKITNEIYPRILTSRKIEPNEKNLIAVGPFPSSSNVIYVLKSIRMIVPVSIHKVEKRPCLRSQIGFCTPCPSFIEGLEDPKLKSAYKNTYMKNVTTAKKILSGEFNVVRTDLLNQMTKSAKSEKYEDARDIRNKLSAFDYITTPSSDPFRYIENPHLESDMRQSQLDDLLLLLSHFIPNIEKLNRVECFDIAHTSGTLATASMVVFIDGEAEKKSYRHFRIFQKNGRSDTDSMTEIAKRRLKHLKDWGKPDLIITDGGRGQVSSFERIFKNSIPVVGIAKQFETLIIPSKERYISIRLSGRALQFIQKIRNESHRFARRYHHHLLKKKLQLIVK